MRSTYYRIGNYVTQNGKETIIDSLERSINDWDRLNGKRTIDVHPIKLTEKWLIEFGYKKKGSFYRLNNSRFAEALIHTEGIDILVHSVEIEYIKYVHELQNLYFTLVGRELKRVDG